MGQIGHSSPQQWSEEFTAAYMGLPPPTRWSVQRANGKYKDHLDGQLTKLQYTMPPDQNNMFSPHPQPKNPLKMQILSQNAIFVTEKVNFYPYNWKFTFLPNRGTTKNELGQNVGQLKIRFSEQIDTPAYWKTLRTRQVITI